ncbi:MAG: hypothetical protein K2X01_00750 [Cyanobacteria bacterium]|nr:hypothetical protein [Cyanobacteriota bacterium]
MMMKPIAIKKVCSNYLGALALALVLSFMMLSLLGSTVFAAVNDASNLPGNMSAPKPKTSPLKIASNQRATELKALIELMKPLNLHQVDRACQKNFDRFFEQKNSATSWKANLKKPVDTRAVLDPKTTSAE